MTLKSQSLGYKTSNYSKHQQQENSTKQTRNCTHFTNVKQLLLCPEDTGTLHRSKGHHLENIKRGWLSGWELQLHSWKALVQISSPCPWQHRCQERCRQADPRGFTGHQSLAALRKAMAQWVRQRVSRPSANLPAKGMCSLVASVLNSTTGSR